MSPISVTIRFVRMLAIAVLSLIGTWLTYNWIASYIWPQEYSRHNRFHNLKIITTARLRAHCGIIRTEGKLPSRQFCVFLHTKPNLPANPSDEESGQAKSFRLPGLRFYSRPFIDSDSPGPPLIASRLTYVESPAWLIISIVWVYPVFWLLLRGPVRRRRRRRRGLCVNCGYNLTGAPEPRCPECGTTK